MDRILYRKPEDAEDATAAQGSNNTGMSLGLFVCNELHWYVVYFTYAIHNAMQSYNLTIWPNEKWLWMQIYKIIDRPKLTLERHSGAVTSQMFSRICLKGGSFISCLYCILLWNIVNVYFLDIHSTSNLKKSESSVNHAATRVAPTSGTTAATASTASSATSTCAPSAAVSSWGSTSTSRFSNRQNLLMEF